ncbi:MAG TPA: hypothetical protein DD426_14515 [Clostridiaceae bacterium]|nr:hypothetical protein [Clostridiaceae bacterium]
MAVKAKMTYMYDPKTMKLSSVADEAVEKYKKKGYVVGKPTNQQNEEHLKNQMKGQPKEYVEHNLDVYRSTANPDNDSYNTAGDYTYDNIQDEIDRLKEASQKAAIAELEKSRNNALSNLDASRSEIESQYAPSRQAASNTSQINKLNFAQYLANRGLTNSGTTGQAEINRNAALQGALSGLNTAQNKDYADVARQEADVNNSFESDKASTMAGIDANTLQQKITAMEQAAQAAQQQRQFEANLALQEAGLTGTYNGTDTLANKQLQQAIAQQALDNQYRNKQLSDTENQSYFENGLNLANLRGIYNGQPTLGLQQLNSDNAYKNAQLELQRQSLAQSAARAKSGGSSGSGSGGYSEEDVANAAYSQLYNMIDVGYGDSWLQQNRSNIINTLGAKVYQDMQKIISNSKDVQNRVRSDKIYNAMYGE